MTLAERLIERGRREGRLEAIREGRLEGRQETLLKLLAQKFGAVADTDKRKIMGIRDLDKLDKALGLIFKTETIAEVLRPLD